MEPLIATPFYADATFIDHIRDQFIDNYLETHPDASEFEAALMWAAEIEQEEPRP